MSLTFESTAIGGVYVIDIAPIADDRGFFARTFCRSEFAARGLEPAVEQSNMSRNHVAGTLRGLHFQTAEAPESKLVRCTRGAVFDVLVDLRPESTTFGEHLAIELSEDNHRAVYVPAMFAHGYMTLVDDTEVHYQVSCEATPGTERGLLFDDPVLEIDWPMTARVVSDKDRAWNPIGSHDELRHLATETVPSA